MAFTDFSEDLFCKLFDTGESVKLGSFQLAKSTELQHIRLRCYIQGTLAGSEQLRLNIYSDETHQNLLYQSSYSNLSSLKDENDVAVTGDYVGQIRVDFNKENLNKNLTYYISAELNNYTRNAETFFFSLAHDFPFPIYDNGQTLFYNTPLAMEIFGLENG